MPEDSAVPGPTPANYQRTTGGHLRWQPPSPEHLQELLPAYEILSVIGKGGMGAVYQGRQKSLDRLVAIKLLPPEAADNDMQFVERFKNEARTMARMNHPAIVHVYDFGETSDGQLYIVMEYIDGTDVAKMIQSQGRLPPEHALAITAHVCDALLYAHTHGVVHRDIKPANILLNMEGQVKVADFGLAKTTEGGQDGLTKTNMAMGTPDFVAPEALTPGMIVDSRADLYAVGVMLYNMLTGQVPRGAFHMPSVTCATDMRFDKIIDKCMQMDPSTRYQTAAEVRRELDVILTTPMAKPGVQTISVKPRDLPQKPVGKSPGAPQQQQLKPGSTGVPVRTQQAPTGGAPPRPGIQPARKTAQNAQTPAAPPQKKSSAGMIYGIAAAVVVVAAAGFMSMQGGKKPAQLPVAKAPESPKPKPAASTPRSGTFTIEAMAGKPAGGAKLSDKGGLIYGWKTGSTLEWSQEQVAAGTYEITLSAGGYRPREHEMRLQVGGQSLNFHLLSNTGSGTKLADYKAGVITLPSIAKGMVLRCVNEGKTDPDKYQVNDFIFRSVKFSAVKPAAPAAPAAEKTDEVLTFAGHRYQFIAGKESWTEARDRAAAMGGHLATITSKEEDEFINRSFRDKLAKDKDIAFIGGIASPTPDWKWVTGEDFTYKPSFSFKAGETRMLSLERGGRLQWQVQPTGTRGQGCIIEWDDDGAASLPVLTFDGHRYQIVTEKLKWEAAKARAESMGGHLATITSKEENDWVSKNIGTHFKREPGDRSNWDRFFIGAIQHKSPDGPWEWVTGEPFSFQPWMKSFPNDKNNTVKVATIHSSTTWDDVTLNYEALSFLVEWDDTAPTKPGPIALTAPANLLALVDVKRDAVFGDWSVDAQGLTLKQAASGVKLLGFNLALPEEYDFEIEFTPTKGKREVMQVLPVSGGTALQWDMGIGKQDPPLFAFGPMLDGKNPDDPKRTEAVVKLPRLQEGRRYRSTVEVRKSSLRALLDGKEVLTWSGDFKRFPMEKSAALKLREVSQAGVGGHDSGVIFHKAELRPPSAAPVVAEDVKSAKPAAPAPPMPAPAPAEPEPPADPRLAQLEAGYQSRYDSDAQKPFLAAVAALNQSYIANGIARARAAAQAKGSLAEINALDAEKTTIESGGSVPAEDAAEVPESLRTLRGTYRTALAQIAAKRDATAAPLLQLYLGALDAYVSDLTKAGKIEEARKVQALRDAKAQPATAPTAEVAAAAPGPQGPAPGNAYTNSLGMKFVPVKGTNTMFCIHETRCQDYAAFAAENPTVNKGWKSANRSGIPVADKDDHPVVNVSWEEAHQFCEWLSKKEGKTYRLPTDEEWSTAVGIGHQERRVKESTPESLRFGLKDEYPWGGDFPPKSKDKADNYFDVSHAEKFNAKARLVEAKLEDYDDGFATTAPVMSFKPNKLGLYDLGGNASEWVEDWFKDDQKDRATRGMNWLSSSTKMYEDMLSSQRGHADPGRHDIGIGFRIVLEAPKKAP